MNAKERKNLTLAEFKELHSKRKTKTLTPYEKYKVMCEIKNPIQENILIHLYIKFLAFGMREFHQRKFDIQVGIGSYALKTIGRNLDSLEKKGYFKTEFKLVKGKQDRRTHFIINIEKMNEFLTVGDDLNPENFSNLIENLRREHEVVKPNPINVKKPSENHTEEITEVKTVESIEEPTEEIKPLKEPVNSYEDIRELDKDLDETKINKTKTKKEMRNERNLEMCEEARLLTEYKDKINLKNIFHDLDLTVDVVNYLYSSEYIEGVDRKLDDKKASIDVIINQKINPLRGIPMMFTL